MEIIPSLKKLTETVGLSGFEQGIRSQVVELWSPLVDQVKTDTLGNLIALKQGSGPEPRRKLMLASHMDEIGLMVTQVKGAFLSITKVGGIDQRLLLGQPVMVHGRDDLPGVIGSRPPHLLKQGERDKLVAWEDLVVDVGLPADRVAELVRVGDLISFRQKLVELGSGGRFVGKALDNRASIVAVAVCLELLRSRLHQWDILAVATVQEEVTLGGAITSAYGLEPDVGIAIDVTFATGPGVSEANDAYPLGKGPTIGFGPNIHPGVYDAMIEAAKAIEMAYKIEPMPRMSGTDAMGMQVSRSGVPTGVLSIPVRNMHMPVEIGTEKDIQRVGRLLAELAARLDEDFVAEKLAWDRDEEEDK